MTSPSIDRERWAQMTILEQMGNIGSEVGRSLNARRAGKTVWATGACERALDLFDATAEVWARQRSPRTREILRAKEGYLTLFFGESSEQERDATERYFNQFALAARANR